MKFLSFGLGAIGTYIGGSLAAAGNEVVFLDHSVSGATHPLHLEFKDHVIDLSELFTAVSLEEALNARSYDVVILAVKSFDTPSVLAEIEPFKKDFPPILCLQNGVENEPLIVAAVGENKVIAGTVTSAVRRLGMGNAVVEKARGVGIESSHPLSSALVNSFNEAGLKTRAYSSRAALKWSKLLTNLQANAIPAILNWTPLEVLSNVQTYALECAAIREAVDVMQALKISVVDLPGTPVRVLVNAMTRWPQWLSRPLIARTLGAARGGKMPSLQMDLTAGRKQSEVEFLNGAVVRAAERAGLAAPVNQALTQILSGMAAGGIPPGRMQSHPEQILRYIMEQL